jgi:uncharacterized protein (TIGR02391 family)
MAKLTTLEKQILEKLFQMSGGYVLNFTDRTMEEFFRDDLKINTYDEKYNYSTGSKANRMRGFWLKEDNKIVGKTILKLIEYIKGQTEINNLKQNEFPNKWIEEGKKIAETLISDKNEKIGSNPKAVFKSGNISITLQEKVFAHVQKLLNDGHYFNAVEKAYKIVRKKLKDITGKEKATDAFTRNNYEKIFGHQPVDDIEKDFFEGVRFLHMAIQFLRNEKAHTPARDLDKNLAIHYIALASLAYGLIDRK